MNVHQWLLIGACLSFGLAAIGASVPRVNLTALGLFLWSLSWFF